MPETSPSPDPDSPAPRGPSSALQSVRQLVHPHPLRTPCGLAWAATFLGFQLSLAGTTTASSLMAWGQWLAGTSILYAALLWLTPAVPVTRWNGLRIALRALATLGLLGLAWAGGSLALYARSGG
ncbi:MAG TPA: hypothetical protein VN783_06240 [Thermoanaerobaculia bacterium]|nr:hypothetical protein [Thermoanaerobaculia bacterium]